jgi:hypothetical protein
MKTQQKKEREIASIKCATEFNKKKLNTDRRILKFEMFFF